MSESIRKKYRSTEEEIALIHRLNRIEGQIRGVRHMVENGDYCLDILTQTAAASAAINAFARAMLSEHITTYVAQEIREGNEGVVDEVADLVRKFMK